MKGFLSLFGQWPTSTRAFRLVRLTDSFITRAQQDGSPIVFAEGLEPVVSPAYNAGVPKRARHPSERHASAKGRSQLQCRQ